MSSPQLCFFGGDGSNGPELPRELRDDPNVASFLASEAFPDDVKQRFVAALAAGGLHPEMLPIATNSWRAISENRCVGTIISVSRSELVLERVADGAEWRIGIGHETTAGRGGQSIPPSELRKGEFVEALSQDGASL
ncbi:MAG TPA: hypothetical protein VJB57_04160 [Dehalococcoidia bacterium]|nr:hypothetical protein [Dehalococcoidia bacterium]